jgi:hypothetical protein
LLHHALSISIAPYKGLKLSSNSARIANLLVHGKI